jgi:hypothetical protein
MCTNNGKKTSILETLNEQWFKDAITFREVEALAHKGYKIIDHDLLFAFTERWLKKTSNFRLSGGEMTVTLVNVSCLLYLTIEGHLLDHDEKLARE